MANSKIRSATLLAVSVAPLAATPVAAQLTVDKRAGSSGPALGVGPSAVDQMALHVINVGQGQSLLFEFSCGLLLVDTGGQTQAVTDWKERFTAYLDQVFARRTDLNRTLAAVYLSHPHPDHTLGVHSLIEEGRYNISNIVVGAHTTGFAIAQQRALVRHANQNRIPQVEIRTTMLHPQLGLTSDNIDPLRCKGREPNIRVLWGQHDEPHRWPKREEEDENNHSVAIRVEFGQSTFLVVGDMEEIAQKAMIARYARNPKVLDADVYVAGHHGSHNGTFEGFVEAMTPELALISAGDPGDREPGYAAYQFGHPNVRAIDRLSHASHGVSFARPVVNVAMGISGANPGTGAPPVLVERDLSRAIFSTGWDGDIVLLAGFDGTKRVIIE